MLYSETRLSRLWGRAFYVFRASLTVLVLSLLGAVSASAQVSVPAVGTGGTDGVLSGDPWTVCRADTDTAWVAANVSGQYNAIVACQALGYTSVDAWGGTCGTVCGYCDVAGNEYYDGGGGSPTSLAYTVHWRCTGYVGQVDTTDATQTMRADFALRRAASLIRNQPDLAGMLRSQGGSVTADTSRGKGQFALTTPGEQPVWAHLTGNWTDAGSVEDEYFLGAVGAHVNLTQDMIVGGMVQFDHARSTDGAAMIEGDGWLIGPYMAARLAGQPLYFEASLLYGDSNNRISPDGSYTDRFDAERMLAQVKLSGEVVRGAVTLMPHLGLSHAVERQDGYTDGLGQTIPKQTIRLTELRYGLNFSLPLTVSSGTMDLTGGLSGIYADVSGDAADSAFADSYDGNRAMLELGLARHFVNGSDLSFGSYYDGIGVNGYESWGLKLSYSTEF